MSAVGMTARLTVPAYNAVTAAPSSGMSDVYGEGSTTLATTQRRLPILRSRANPNLSQVDSAPSKRKPAGTEPASSG